MKSVDAGLKDRAFSERVRSLLEMYQFLKRAAHHINPDVGGNVAMPYIHFWTEDSFFESGCIYWATPVALERGILKDAEQYKVPHHAITGTLDGQRKAGIVNNLRLREIVHLAEYVNEVGLRVLAAFGVNGNKGSAAYVSSFREVNGELVFDEPIAMEAFTGHLPYIVTKHLRKRSRVEDHTFDLYDAETNTGYTVYEPPDVVFPRSAGGPPEVIEKHKMFIDFEREGRVEDLGMVHIAEVTLHDIDFKDRSFVHVGATYGLMVLEALRLGATSVKALEAEPVFVDLLQKRVQKLPMTLGAIDRFELQRVGIVPNHWDDAVLVQLPKPMHSMVVPRRNVPASVKDRLVHAPSSGSSRVKQVSKLDLTERPAIDDTLTTMSLLEAVPTPPDIMLIETGACGLQVLKELPEDYVDAMEFVDIVFGVRDILRLELYATEMAIQELIASVLEKLRRRHTVHTYAFPRIVCLPEDLEQYERTPFPTTMPAAYYNGFLDFEFFAIPK